MTEQRFPGQLVMYIFFNKTHKNERNYFTYITTYINTKIVIL